MVDMDGVDYISSIGLSALLKIAKRSQAAGERVAVCGLREYVNEVFAISGVLTLFTVHEVRAEAVASFGAAPSQESGDAQPG